MLVIMESSFGLCERIREMQRAEAAPYVGMPPLPRWVPPFFGAWFAAYVGVFAFWHKSGLTFIITMIALSAGMGAFLGWLTQRYGALPTPGRGTPPPEIRREYQRYAVGAVVVAGLVAGVWWWAGIVAASAAAFALVTAGLSLYQARYERAAAIVRERLA
jgi:hypothetical protein